MRRTSPGWHHTCGAKRWPALRKRVGKEDTLCLRKRTRRPSGVSLRRCSTAATLSWQTSCLPPTISNTPHWGVFDIVGGKQLVCQLKVAAVEHLLRDTPEGRLVLFRRHRVSSFPTRFLRAGHLFAPQV